LGTKDGKSLQSSQNMTGRKTGKESKSQHKKMRNWIKIQGGKTGLYRDRKKRRREGERREGVKLATKIPKGKKNRVTAGVFGLGRRDEDGGISLHCEKLGQRKLRRDNR